MDSPRKKSRLHDTTLRDLISHLPDECIMAIFSFLPSSRDRCSCAAVSKKWLFLQANMRHSEFKFNPKPMNITSTLHNPNINQISRCLEGKKANDTSLAAIAVGICPLRGLSELCIRGSLPSEGITDLGLCIIAQACPALKSLSLWDCTKVGRTGIGSIARRCNSLEKLDLINLPSVDNWGLIAIARNCPSLSTLNLESCLLIDNMSLDAFARYSSKLESLSLVNCPLIGDQGIISIISSLPKLAKLKLIAMSIGNGVLEALSHHGRSLSCLSIENISGITELGFGLIRLLEKLKVLSLKSCSRLDDTSFKAMGNGFIGLNQISIQNCETLTDDGLKELTKSTSLLERFKLEECNSITWNGLIEMFTNCSKSLKALSLVRCRKITDDPSICKPSFVPKYPSLRSLTLKRCSRIGDTFLSWIGNACAQVKHLSLIELKSITDRGVVTLVKTVKNEPKSLVRVELRGCTRITDWSVCEITSLFGEKLEMLILDGCERLSDRSLKMIAERCPCLLHLELSKCGISDNGVICLATSQLHRLEVLSLAGCVGITDHSLRYLEVKFGSLEGLNLMHCSGLSKKGINSVRETLWWCDLVY